MIDVSMKTAQADVVGSFHDSYKLHIPQSPDEEAPSAMGYAYSALPPSPLHVYPSPTKMLRGRNQSFTQRLQGAAALQEATHERLKANRTAINDAKEERLAEASATKRENKRMIKEAGIGNIKAPGFEEAQSVKERLRRIDEAAHANAQRIRERRQVLERAVAEEAEERRQDAEAQAKRKKLVLLSSPDQKTKADLNRERLKNLRPPEGPDAAERMSVSMATLRELLPRCASDLGWAEKRLEEKRALALQSGKSTGSLAPPDSPVAGWSPTSGGGRPGSWASRGRGGAASTGQLPDIIRSSASAPSLWRETRPLMPKPGHTKLYPSMMERFRVIEGHARKNAEIIQALRH